MAAQVGVALLVGASSSTPKVHGFDSRSGHLPRLQVHPQLGAYQRQLIDVSLSHLSSSLSLSFSLSLKSISMSLSEDLKKEKQ